MIPAFVPLRILRSGFRKKYPAERFIPKQQDLKKSYDVVIIGGGVSRAGDLLLEPIRRTVRARVSVMPVEQVEVVPSRLGNNAGVIGVACWAASRQ